jgi:hypothetical protein
MTIRLPLEKAAFTVDKQSLFRKAVAATVAGEREPWLVRYEHVTIKEDEKKKGKQDVVNRNGSHGGGVFYDVITQVRVNDDAAASSLVSTWDQSRMNEHLRKMDFYGAAAQDGGSGSPQVIQKKVVHYQVNPPKKSTLLPSDRPKRRTTDAVDNPHSQPHLKEDWKIEAQKKFKKQFSSFCEYSEKFEVETEKIKMTEVSAEEKKATDTISKICQSLTGEMGVNLDSVYSIFDSINKKAGINGQDEKGMRYKDLEKHLVKHLKSKDRHAIVRGIITKSSLPYYHYRIDRNDEGQMDFAEFYNFCKVFCCEKGSKWKELGQALKWKDAGSEKPSAGTEIKNERLAAALQNQVEKQVEKQPLQKQVEKQFEFTKEEWEKFQVADLSSDSYIKAGDRDRYFKPAFTALKWKEAPPPSAGTEKSEIKNELLAAALQNQVEFKKEEWEKFQVENLSSDSYIKAGSRYFKPAFTSYLCDYFLHTEKLESQFIFIDVVRRVMGPLSLYNGPGHDCCWYTHLLIWSLLMNRTDIAKALWAKAKWPVASALQASNMLHSLIPHAASRIRHTMEESANIFEHYAISVQHAAMEDKPQMALPTINRELFPDWKEGITLLDLAMHGDLEDFMESHCEEALLDRLYDSTQEDQASNFLNGLKNCLKTLFHICTLGLFYDQTSPFWAFWRIPFHVFVFKYLVHLAITLFFTASLYGYFDVRDFSYAKSYLSFSVENWEIVLAVYLASKFLTEVIQVVVSSDYGGSFWNYVDIMECGTFLGPFFVRISTMQLSTPFSQVEDWYVLIRFMISRV